MPVRTTSRWPCVDAAPDLGEHGGRAAAPRGAAHERDDAEAAREQQPSCTFTNARTRSSRALGLDAADRADVARDEGRRLLARPGDDDDVLGQAAKASAARFAPQPVT